LTCLLLNTDAQGGTRTRTDLSTRPSNVRGYQLRHLSKFSKTKPENYFFVLAVLAFGAFAALLAAVLVEVFDAVFAGIAEFERFVIGGTVTAEFASVFAGALASTFALVFAAGVEDSVVSGLLDKTETPPLSAGIESISAESIKTVAAMIVVFDRTVAVPREPKALLEILLVKSAPASVLPG
jgi:hypothetical protein